MDPLQRATLILELMRDRLGSRSFPLTLLSPSDDLSEITTQPLSFTDISVADSDGSLSTSSDSPRYGPSSNPLPFHLTRRGSPWPEPDLDHQRFREPDFDIHGAVYCCADCDNEVRARTYYINPGPLNEPAARTEEPAVPAVGEPHMREPTSLPPLASISSPTPDSATLSTTQPTFPPTFVPHPKTTEEMDGDFELESTVSDLDDIMETETQPAEATSATTTPSETDPTPTARGRARSAKRKLSESEHPPASIRNINLTRTQPEHETNKGGPSM